MLASLDISLGALTAFVLPLQRFFVPIMSLGNEWQTVQAALAELVCIFQVLELPSEAPTPGSLQQPQYKRNAAIEMRQVVFGYLPNRPVLHGVSLLAQPGEHIVLLGRTGALTTPRHARWRLLAPRRGAAGVEPLSLPRVENGKPSRILVLKNPTASE